MHCLFCFGMQDACARSSSSSERGRSVSVKGVAGIRAQIPQSGCGYGALSGHYLVQSMWDTGVLL